MKSILVNFGDEYIVLPMASHRVNAIDLAQHTTQRQVAHGEQTVTINPGEETLVVFPRYSPGQAFVYGHANEFFLQI